MIAEAVLPQGGCGGLEKRRTDHLLRENPASNPLSATAWISGLNGCSVTGVAVLALLLLLPFRFSWLGLFGGASIALSGFVEVLGHRKIKAGDPEGLRLAALSQVMVFASIFIYSICQYWLIDPAAADLLSPEVRRFLVDLYRIEPYLLDELVSSALRMTAVSLVVASLIYQGSMLLYYRRKQKQLIRPETGSASPHIS